MNPTIVKIIDLMFRGMPENEETNAMREELLTNSQARYEDLLAAGESPNTALGQVLDSLRGMEDVLDEYRQNASQRISNSQTSEDTSPFDKFERMAEEIEDRFEQFADKAENTAKSAFDTAMEGLRSAMNSVSGLFSQPAGSQDNATGSQPAAGANDTWKATATWEFGDATTQPTAGALLWQPTSDEDTLSLTLSPAEVSRLNVQLTGEDIEVAPSTDGLIHVEISKADENLYLVENAGGCLTIRRNPMGNVTHSQSDTSETMEGLGGILSGVAQAFRNMFNAARTCGDTLCLKLPHGLEKITLLTASGDIDVDSLNQKAASLSTTSGDVEISACTFTGPVSLNTTSGDVAVEDTVFHAPVSLNTTSGDLDFHATAPQVNANTTSGDLELEGDVQQIKANSVSGDLDLRPTGSLVSITANTTSGDITAAIGEDIIPAVRLNTTSGDTQVLTPTHPDAACTIQLNSVSGDLTVENF